MSDTLRPYVQGSAIAVVLFVVAFATFAALTARPWTYEVHIVFRSVQIVEVCYRSNGDILQARPMDECTEEDDA